MVDGGKYDVSKKRWDQKTGDESIPWDQIGLPGRALTPNGLDGLDPCAIDIPR